jgi:hypothetical protein
MNTHDVLDHPDTFEARLRSGLDHLAHADPIGDPGEFDSDAMLLAAEPPQPSSRLVPVLAAAAAVAAVTVGGLVVIASRDTSPVASDQPTRPAVVPDPQSAPPASTGVADSELTPAAATQFAAGELPRFGIDEAGWTMTYASESDLGGSYSFEHTDGRTLEIHTFGGGEDGFRGSIGGDQRITLTENGEEWSLLDYAATPEGGGDARFRANVLRGDWTWEFDGAPFTSPTAFLDTVTGIHPVDDATWDATLPDDIISASDQSATVAALLEDVPLPDGFDTEALNDGSTNSRYQFIAKVSSAVTCAWLDQWFTGQESADLTIQDQAATAMATSTDWAMLKEIAAQGGWANEVWQHAEAINGGEGVLTGAGPQPPSREEANSALGCEI